MRYIMESTSKSETAQANTNPDNQQSNLDIMLKINLLAACIKFERNRLMFELLIRLAIRMQKDRYEDEDPEDEDDPDNEEDLEDEEEQDDDEIPDFELTDEDGLDWDEDRDDDPEDEDDLDNEEDLEGEEDSDNEEDQEVDDIPDFEVTDEGDLDWDEDQDENGLPYWVPDEVWNPEDELDAEEETEPVDSKIVPIGWDVDQDNYDDPDEEEEDY